MKYGLTKRLIIGHHKHLKMLTNLFYRKMMSKFLTDIKILFFRLRNFEKQIRRCKKRKAPCHKAFRIR